MSSARGAPGSRGRTDDGTGHGSWWSASAGGSSTASAPARAGFGVGASRRRARLVRATRAGAARGVAGPRRSPRRALLTRGEAVEGWETFSSPQDVYRLHDVNDLLVEGGSATATAFLADDLVDRILIYRAPIIVGEGKSSFGYIGLEGIADAHGRWRAGDARALGVDRLEVYERVRDS